MQLVGVNRSPYTRRVAITLRHYGVPFEQRDLSGFGNRTEVRAANPLGRIPALVLDGGETLVDSGAIVDHLDQTYGAACPLTPPAGADRRAVLRVAALMMGACDKGLQAAYERNHHPPEKVHCRHALVMRLLEKPASCSTQPPWQRYPAVKVKLARKHERIPPDKRRRLRS